MLVLPKSFTIFAPSNLNFVIMSTKTWAKLSLGISVLALAVSIIALVNRCPTESPSGHVSFDYMGVLIGILALLVTALIGAQVGQYLFVDRRIETTAGKIARIIAHKSANDIARKTAEGAIEDLAKDTTIIAHGKEVMKNVPNLMMFGEYLPVIDAIIEAISIFKTCSYPTISSPAIEDALLSLDKTFEYCEGQGVPRCLEGKKGYYISVLKDVRNTHIKRCIEYLQSAKECPANTDYDLREAEGKAQIDSMMND